MRLNPWNLFSLWLLATCARAEDAILVFDASGSMWGQIQGKAKIEIARNVIGDLLAEVPAERRLGLVAYGHRREGDCADIEEVVPVGSDRAAIRAKVDSIKPKGKTPLSEGVRFAAQKLRYTEQKSTVILVSDGAESCNVDPCALGRELEAAGAERTVTVVLEFAVSATLTPTPAGSAAAGSRVAVNWQGPDRQDDFVTVVAAGDPPTAFNDYQLTKSGNPLTIHMPATPGAYELRYVLGRPPRVLTTVPVTVTPATASIDAPAEVGAGASFPIAWTGPDGEGDWLTIVAPDALPAAYASYVDAGDGSSGTLKAPVAPGHYELRYVAGGTNVLARVPITVAAVTASIEAPQTVTTGSSFDITWQGPNNSDDWLTIVKPSAEAASYASYVDANNQSAGTLQAPAAAGEYELRYVQGGTVVLARRAIRVVSP